MANTGIADGANPDVQQMACTIVSTQHSAAGDGTRHRYSKLPQPQGIFYSDGSIWTWRHELWLRRQVFEVPALTAAVDNDCDAALSVQSRPNFLDDKITEMAATDLRVPVMTRLQCLRGASTLTVFGLAVEIGDCSRFTGSTIRAYTGLVPSEYSNVDSRSQDSIAKTGNRHVSRLLVKRRSTTRRVPDDGDGDGDVRNASVFLPASNAAPPLMETPVAGMTACLRSSGWHAPTAPA